MNIRSIKRVLGFSCGFVVGITFAYVIVHLVQIKAGRDLLEAYSLRLLNKSALIGVTTQQAFDAVNHDNLAFCSDQELEFMRVYTSTAPTRSKTSAESSKTASSTAPPASAGSTFQPHPWCRTSPSAKQLSACAGHSSSLPNQPASSSERMASPLS